MFFNEEMDEAVRNSMRSLIKRGFVDYFWDAERARWFTRSRPRVTQNPSDWIGKQTTTKARLNSKKGLDRSWGPDSRSKFLLNHMLWLKKHQDTS